MSTKAKKLTYCTWCDSEVGVWATPFNRTAGTSFAPVTKTSAHKSTLTGRRCHGSLVAISPNVAFDAK